jgi:hypothetical protein
MISPMTGGVKVHIMDLMNGIPFAVKYFDDDKNLYVSRVLFEELKAKGPQTGMTYVTMAWKKSSITIEDAIKRLWEDVEAYRLEQSNIQQTELDGKIPNDA